MENFYEIDGLKASIDRTSVFNAIDCREDSPVYEEVLEEYEELSKDMRHLVKPIGILGFAALPKELATEKYPEGTPIIYGVLSVGDGIKKCSTQAFQQGDYVKGMLCDAMADAALFSLEGRMLEKLQEVCAEHGTGILARLEAPYDVPMEAQRVAWEYLELNRRYGIKISSGYMLDPVKTSCQIFVLTEDEKAFAAQHDCRKCPNVNCKMRKPSPVKITVRQGSEESVLVLEPGKSLMDGLLQNGYYISAFCGGKGRCGKCRIRVLKGNAEITPEDRRTFTKEELAKGWRLSCMAFPLEDWEIAFQLEDEQQFEILGGRKTDPRKASLPESEYDIAADIGTTTIAMELIGKDSGKVLHTVTAINSQRVYGADVITRIKASVDGRKQDLQESIRKDLRTGIRRLLQEAGVKSGKVGRIILSGNTTMGHLLMGYDCTTLGVYPFTPVNLDFITGTVREILGDQEEHTEQAQVVLLPGISTYVGGDIVSGLYACGFYQEEEICLLVDLGTNGEMALGNQEKILVTSTAAGPAFEGGNITWGMGSVPGAICSAKLDGEKAVLKTIQDREPEGICGTGVVEIASELVKEELVDETGLLDEAYFESGFPLGIAPDGRQIVFTQKDVREIQLAKAAIRAGMETLILRYGITKDQVKKVYLAGGFGYKLDKEKAVEIGMFPEEFLDRIETVGNSSLEGAADYLLDEEAEAKINRIRAVSKEIPLSADKDFNELYMDFMFFERD